MADYITKKSDKDKKESKWIRKKEKKIEYIKKKDKKEDKKEWITKKKEKTEFEKIKEQRTWEDKKSRSLRAKIDTVRKGGIGADRITDNMKSPERATKWLKDPGKHGAEKYWKSEGRLYHEKGGRAGGGAATHGLGRAFLKGGKV